MLEDPIGVIEHRWGRLGIDEYRLSVGTSRIHDEIQLRPIDRSIGQT
jgi:hypothetical protein